MGKPEGKIEDYLKEYAEANHFLCFKFMPITCGVPDRIIIGYGKTVFVEVKKPGGKTRKLQDIIIQRMINHGALVYVIDTKEKVRELIDTIIHETPDDKIKYYQSISHK